MPIQRPPPFTDSDVLTFRQTPASKYRIAYTFVESLNEGTLFDRSARIFEEAARTQRLYDVVVGEDQRTRPLSVHVLPRSSRPLICVTACSVLPTVASVTRSPRT